MASRKSSIEQVTVPSKSTGHSAVPSLAIAEELRGRLDEPFIVIRAADDTDEDVEAGQKLIAAALAFARRK